MQMRISTQAIKMLVPTILVLGLSLAPALIGNLAAQTDTSPTTTTYYEADGVEDVPPAACAGCLAVGMAVPLVFLVLSIGIALWIFRDATERGIQAPPLWAILGFFLNVLGLVIYLIARKNMSTRPPAAPGTGSIPPPPPPPPVG
jgi:NADH:ubiquinone oxidoreductase subunit 3 (subunit A)